MKIAKIQSKVLTTALNNRKDFFCLSSYMSNFRIEGDCIISPYSGEESELNAIISDYCFNEKESEKLFSLAKEILGSEIIDMNIIKIISI